MSHRSRDIDLVTHRASTEIKDGELGLWLGEKLADIYLLSVLKDTQRWWIVIEVLRRTSITAKLRPFYVLLKSLRSLIEANREPQLKSEHNMAHSLSEMWHWWAHDRKRTAYISNILIVHDSSPLV
jgi:hypothetical protein